MNSSIKRSGRFALVIILAGIGFVVIAALIYGSGTIDIGKMIRKYASAERAAQLQLAERQAEGTKKPSLQEYCTEHGLKCEAQIQDGNVYLVVTKPMLNLSGETWDLSLVQTTNKIAGFDWTPQSISIRYQWIGNEEILPITRPPVSK